MADQAGSSQVSEFLLEIEHLRKAFGALMRRTTDAAHPCAARRTR